MLKEDAKDWTLLVAYGVLLHLNTGAMRTGIEFAAVPAHSRIECDLLRDGVAERPFAIEGLRVQSGWECHIELFVARR